MPPLVHIARKVKYLGRRKALIFLTYIDTTNVFYGGLFKPPAQIRTCATNASGSYFESNTEPLIWIWVTNFHTRDVSLN